MARKGKDRPENMGEALIMAEILNGRCSLTGGDSVKGITVRVSIDQLATIEAMAQVSKSNRNKVIQRLLLAGIEATDALLDEEAEERINAVRAKIMQGFISAEGLQGFEAEPVETIGTYVPEVKK